MKKEIDFNANVISQVMYKIAPNKELALQRYYKFKRNAFLYSFGILCILFMIVVALSRNNQYLPFVEEGMVAFSVLIALVIYTALLHVFPREILEEIHVWQKLRERLMTGETKKDFQFVYWRFSAGQEFDEIMPFHYLRKRYSDLVLLQKRLVPYGLA